MDDEEHRRGSIGALEHPEATSAAVGADTLPGPPRPPSDEPRDESSSESPGDQPGESPADQPRGDRAPVDEPARRVPERPLDPDDRITRFLCAGAYLHASYASHVTNVLLTPFPGAICPPWGVDAVWLARHAVQAKRLRRERDLNLMYTLAAVLLGGTTVLGLLLFGRLPVSVAITDWVVLWIVGYAAAFGLVFNQYRVARGAALSLAYDPVPLSAPPLEDPAQEGRLDALREANTVVFARDHMFVGSGERLDHATMTVDIGRGATRDDGKRVKPKRFDGLDLHRELLQTVPKGLRPKPLIGHRLYVRSGYSVKVPIFPHGPVDGDLAQEMAFRRPVNQVPEPVLEHFLRRPDDSARVYSVFEQRGWGGQVTVTLFVRGRVVGKTLFVELDVFAQPKLQSAFSDVRRIRMRRADELPALIRSVLPVALPLLIGSARRRWQSWREDQSDARELRDLARDISRRRDIDFGASSSLREDSSGGSLQDSDRFPWADEEMYSQIMSARVLDCIKDFLIHKDVDTSSFERQQITFIEKTTIKARDIYGSALNKGVNKTTGSGAGGGQGGGNSSDGGD